MKVLCIDNKPYKNDHAGNLYLVFLNVGEEYEVEWQTDQAFKIKGIEPTGIHAGLRGPTFLKKRFIPISSIDETEMQRDYSTIKTLTP